MCKTSICNQLYNYPIRFLTCFATLNKLTKNTYVGRYTMSEKEHICIEKTTLIVSSNRTNYTRHISTLCLDLWKLRPTCLIEWETWCDVGYKRHSTAILAKNLVDEVYTEKNTQMKYMSSGTHVLQSKTKRAHLRILHQIF